MVRKITVAVILKFCTSIITVTSSAEKPFHKMLLWKQGKARHLHILADYIIHILKLFLIFMRFSIIQSKIYIRIDSVYVGVGVGAGGGSKCFTLYTRVIYIILRYMEFEQLQKITGGIVYF